MVGYLGAYAFSRLFDLTWGNRPSDSISTHDHTSARQLEMRRTELRTSAQFVCLLIVIANFLVVMLVIELENGLYTLFTVAVAVFLWPLAQMSLSFLFLIRQIVYDASRCCKACVLCKPDQ